MVGAGGPALAAEDGYGQHVLTCVQTGHDGHLGFVGDMNPGVMHQGASNWDPSHDCTSMPA